MSKPRYHSIETNGEQVTVFSDLQSGSFLSVTKVVRLLNEREELEARNKRQVEMLKQLEAEAARLMRNMLGAIEKPAWKTGVTIFEATRELISWLHEHDPIFSAETDKLVEQDEADSELPESESQS